METKQCEYCTETFVGLSNKRFCSAKCRVASHQKQKVSAQRSINNRLRFASKYTPVQMEIMYRYSMLAGEFACYCSIEECELGGLETMQELYQEVKEVRRMLMEDSLNQNYDYEDVLMWQVVEGYCQYMKMAVEELRSGSSSFWCSEELLNLPVNAFDAVKLIL